MFPIVGQKNVENEVSEFEGSLLAKSPGPIPAVVVEEFSLLYHSDTFNGTKTR